METPTEQSSNPYTMVEETNMSALAQENQELRAQLLAAKDVISKQQVKMEKMEKTIQRLVLGAPPTSPTSIMESSLGSLNPPRVPSRKKSLSTEDQEILAAALAGCQQDFPVVVAMEGSPSSNEESSRRISSITIPDGVASKSGLTPSPRKARSALHRRPTPLPSTPERQTSDGSTEQDRTEFGLEDAVSRNETSSSSETVAWEEEGIAAANSFSTTVHHRNKRSLSDGDPQQNEMPELVSMKSGISTSQHSTRSAEDGFSRDKFTTSRSRSRPRPSLTRRPTPLPSTPERKSAYVDEDSESASNQESEHQDHGQVTDLACQLCNVSLEATADCESPDCVGDKQAASDAYLAALMSQLASSDLPPRSPTRKGCQEKGKRTGKQDVPPARNKLRGAPPSSSGSPKVATLARMVLSNAVRGLPREGSIEQHSDDDITVYPSPAQELGRTIEVSHHPVLDGQNERGLYTGSIDRKSHKPEGYGQMKYRQGQEYTGDWEKGQWHGHGSLKMKNGDLYEGCFVKHKKHGAGLSRFRDGRVFKGRFAMNAMAEGRMDFTDNSHYDGIFENGKRNSFGMYVFSDGSYYEGQWENDQMHGRGRIEWSDGSSYNGDWKYGIQHGIGTEYDSEGRTRHKGEFYNGHPFSVPLQDRLAGSTHTL